MAKFIFITGGVVSSLGKGLASASLAAALQSRGYTVRLRKLDPYLNVDPGTMSPIQHGEVYVTDDGAETDLDLGHYERFTDVVARKGDNITTGQIYSKLIAKERRGEYLGGTVQVIPHVTDLIKEFILSDTDDTDFVLCEIGGTVGDIEGLPFFESIRQLGYQLGKDKTIFVHLTLVPYIPAAKELKTKPTQHSVKELRQIGIQPDILLCRADREIPESERKKIALFCNIKEECVIQGLDVKSIYQVPIKYHEEGFDNQILMHFNMPHDKKANLKKWEKLVENDLSATEEIHVAIVGKYIKLTEAYKSIIESLHHAAMANEVNVKIHWINSRRFSADMAAKKLPSMDAILVPGGFGEDGVKGELNAITYARTNNVPYLGICRGMQLSVIEAARNLAGLKNADTSEFNETEHTVVGLMTEWFNGEKQETRNKNGDLGGTMRLGSYPCKLVPNSLARNVYGKANIEERHRHRYEVNIEYKEILEKAGLLFSGMSPDGKLTEIIEIPKHPWFIAVQFHPEFKSRPFSPHPLFKGFVEAAIKYNKKRK
ncbi:MAG: CTP synthetase [Alphaproteobacteria bacterium CG11_big_fil_rev_8_21_14_0_20_39_49]|nr:MAG: CTP synthetase [Alphaproteobacteria bacterium CG11_big_fil_rev_8_21_14_0_20_39_49]